MSTKIEQMMTMKQRAFCDEYLIDMNATRAALAVGYSVYTAMSGNLMQVTKIKMYLKERMEARAQQAQVNHDMVLRELCKIAFGNLRNCFLPDGGLKPVHELSDDEAAALWSVSVSNDGAGAAAGTTTKIRMYNKLMALDKIAKHLDFYKQEDKPAEPNYIYLTTDELTQEDYFEDDVDYRPGWEERHAVKVEQVRMEMAEKMRLAAMERELKETQASRCKNQEVEKATQESGCKTQEDLNVGDGNADANVPVDEDGRPLCDGAGIPYGRIKKIFRFDLEESVEENLVRMRLYESGDESKAESAAAIARNREPLHDDPLVQTAMELDAEFKRYGIEESRYKGLCVTEQMNFLESLRNRRVA
jgi:hypothetical protein